MKDLKILVTNDDGYQTKGLKTLSEILSGMGKIGVVAPKFSQSGMSMSINLGPHPLAYKYLGFINNQHWAYLDATPATCVKLGLKKLFPESKPDLIISGINHGTNTSMASNYSGTLGAAQEGAINGIISMGVSINEEVEENINFESVITYLPGIINCLYNKHNQINGIYYNINFPNLPKNQIKGIRWAYQGKGRWKESFLPWEDLYSKLGVTAQDHGRVLNEPNEGEVYYMMKGEFMDEDQDERADHKLIEQGYITIVPHTIYNTDLNGIKDLNNLNIDTDF